MQRQQITAKQIEAKIHEENNKKKIWIGRTIQIGSTSVSYGILILWGLVSIFPFFWALFASFKLPHILSITGINPIPHSGEWTLTNYTSVFSSDGLSDYANKWISNSIIYSLVSATLNATLNLLGGYALARIAMKGKNLVVMYFIVSILVPAQATFVPTYFIFTKVGIISATITPSAFLMGIIFSGMANIVMTFMARQFFLTQTSEMEEAGKLDGFSSLNIFLRITLRKMLPLFATQFVLVFMGAWNNFLTFQLFSGGDPLKMTLNSGAYMVAQSATDKELGYGQALAISNISFIPMFLIYGISLKIQLNGIKGGNK